MTIPQIIIPRPAKREEIELRQDADELYKIWREDKDASEPKFEWFNVRFVHDPEWRERVASISCARALGHPVWVVVAILFGVAQVSAILTRFWFR